jgi:hypothetical protein
VTQADVDAELLRDDDLLAPQTWAVVDDLRGGRRENGIASQRPRAWRACACALGLSRCP